MNLNPISTSNRLTSCSFIQQRGLQLQEAKDSGQSADARLGAGLVAGGADYCVMLVYASLYCFCTCHCYCYCCKLLL